MADTLVSEVLPEGTPFQYDTALSFLQPEDFDPRHPTRVTFFLPEVPLAIDLLGKDARPQYGEASDCIRHVDWQALQTEISLKRFYFGQYCCAYLQIYQGEPCDAPSLRERIRELLGSYIT